MRHVHVLICLLANSFLVFALWALPIQEEQFQKAIHLMETKGDYKNAITLFEEVATGPDRNLAARALLYVGLCYEKIGVNEAMQAYQRIIHDFSEQEAEVAKAQAKLKELSEKQSIALSGDGPYSRRLWSGVDVDILGHISPDGQYLSFVNWDTGDLAIRALKRGESRDLGLKEGGWEVSDGFALVSRFSRSGEQLVYNWYYSMDLKVVDRNGKNETIVYKNGVVEPTPHDWSPDGRSILAVLRKEDGSQALCEVSLEGTVRNLRNYDWPKPENAKYSPDGSYIVYDINPAKNERKRDIILLWLDANREVPLVRHLADDRFIGWTPDGSQILFSSDRRGTIDLWVLDIDQGEPAGEPRLVKSNLGIITPLGIDNNGTMYYGVDKGSLDIFVTTLDSISAETNPQTVKLSDIGINRWPEFSHDGKWLAYFSQRGRNQELGSQFLSIHSLENGERREFHLTKVTTLWQPRWSRDGNYIFAAGYGPDGQGIFRIDVHTGETDLFVKNPGEENYQAPDCSPDGRLIYWKQNNHGVFVRDDESLQHKQIYATDDSAWVAAYAVSPDGEHVAICLGIQEGRKIYVMPATGGKLDLKTEVNSEFGFPNDSFEWSQDGEHIFYVIYSDPAELWKVSVKDGRQSLVLRYPSPGEWNNMAIHTGIGKFAYKQGDGSQSEVWMLANFIPELLTAKGNE